MSPFALELVEWILVASDLGLPVEVVADVAGVCADRSQSPTGSAVDRSVQQLLLLRTQDRCGENPVFQTLCSKDRH